MKPYAPGPAWAGTALLAEPDAEEGDARTLWTVQGAAIRYRIAFDPRVGHKVLILHVAQPRETARHQAGSGHRLRVGLRRRQSLEFNIRALSRSRRGQYGFFGDSRLISEEASILKGFGS
jgi:hypothetical protein